MLQQAYQVKLEQIEKQEFNYRLQGGNLNTSVYLGIVRQGRFKY